MKQEYLSSPFLDVRPNLGARAAQCCRFPSAPAAWSPPADRVRLEPRLSSAPLRSVARACAVPPQSRYGFIAGSGVWCGCDTSVGHVSALPSRELCDIWVFVYVWMLSCACLHLCEHCKLWCLLLNVSSWQIDGGEWTAASASCIPNHVVGEDTVGRWFDHQTSGMFGCDEMMVKRWKLHCCSRNSTIAVRRPSHRLFQNFKKAWLEELCLRELSGDTWLYYVLKSEENRLSIEMHSCTQVHVFWGTKSQNISICNRNLAILLVISIVWTPNFF